MFFNANYFLILSVIQPISYQLFESKFGIAFPTNNSNYDFSDAKNEWKCINE